MPNSLFANARRAYHAGLLSAGVLCLTEKKGNQIPSNADGSSRASVAIAAGIYRRVQETTSTQGRLKGQVAGSRFEESTREFLESTFLKLPRLRPGKWIFVKAKKTIARFEQYQHLAKIDLIAATSPELEILLGRDYLIAPDIMITRLPESDQDINANQMIVGTDEARHTPLREVNNKLPILHASISCKWTLRSDRAQNARSEALNLIRNRKGRAPHIVVVTGEPLPSRLTSLALGTGDLDCVYHFALPELLASVDALDMEDSSRLLRTMVTGNRLKDITDLPFDLAI